MTSTRGANSCKREGSSPIPLGAQRRRKQRKRHDQREPPLAACAVYGQSPAGKQTPRSGWEDAGFSPPCLLQPTPTARSGAAAAAGDRHCRDRALTRSGRDKGTSARLSFPSWARAQGQAVGTAPVPGLGAGRAGFPSSGAVEVDRPLQPPDPRSGVSEGAAPPHRLLPAVPCLSPTGGEADLICSARSSLCSELPGASSGNSAQRINSGLQLEFPLLPPHFPRCRRAEGRWQGKSRGGVISSCSPFTWTIGAPRPPWSHTQWTVGMIP